MTNKKLLLHIIFQFVLLFGYSNFVKAESVYIPGKYIVKLKKGVNPDNLQSSLDKSSSFQKSSRLIMKPDLVGSENWKRFYTYYTPDKSVTKQDIINLFGEENIEYIEQDHTLEFFEFPADDLFNHQWYLFNTGQEYYGIKRGPDFYDDSLVLKAGTASKDIRLLNFYQFPPPDSTKVVVAIIDTGVDSKHPELQGRFWKNPGEIPGDGIDNDVNGYVDDTLGYDISGNIGGLIQPIGDNDPSDILGHGTHIAGIIAANNDGKGVVGIAPWIEIMPIKIRPNINLSVAVESILYAVSSGAKIISISWGSPFISSTLLEALEFACNNNVLVCIAAGNFSNTVRYYPAAYDSIPSLVVAAGNSKGYMTGFTTYGAHIDIVAPGEDILSIKPDTMNMYELQKAKEYNFLREIDSLYLLADGTSMATPVVAGAAALLLSFRPDLTMLEVRNILLMGATDLVDPWGNSAYNVPGVDTFSGHGYININQSMDLLNLTSMGSIAFVEPELSKRYTSDVPVKIKKTGNLYPGYWRLEYIKGHGTTGWQFLAEGAAIPSDSVIYIYDDTTYDGNIKLRLIDNKNSIAETSFLYIRNKKVEIISPVNDERIIFSFPIRGSVYGPGFDSLKLEYSKNKTNNTRLLYSTGEHFDSLLFSWTASGNDTGSFTIILNGYFGQEIIADTVVVEIMKTFSNGWPREIGAYVGVSPVCADLEHDGSKELIVATTNGLLIFNHDGTWKNDTLNLYLSGYNVRCMPAIYDIDYDGIDEIIVTSDSMIHAVNVDGSYVEGWPIVSKTGRASDVYGHPNPLITRLGNDKDTVITFANMYGQIMAYRFDGTSYFYSMNGVFAKVNGGIASEYHYTGNGTPTLNIADINQDGIDDAILTYGSGYRDAGLRYFNVRTGEPSIIDDTNGVRLTSINGSVLADFDRDSTYEVVISGFSKELVNSDTLDILTLTVKKNGYDNFPGWPVKFPNITSVNFLSSFPTAADLDLDSIPEILFTVFTYGQAHLYILKSDGTPFLDDSPDGKSFTIGASMGNPIVANLKGDEYPEIIFQTGHLLPGTGTEKLYVLDYKGSLLPDFPIETPALPYEVISSRYAPLIDDLDNDGLVELIMYSSSNDILVWDFEAEYDANRSGKFLIDNINSNKLPIPPLEVQTGIYEENLLLPQKISLEQNYPNPFNPVTVISFDLPERTKVDLEVFNTLGQKVTTLVSDELKAGNYKIKFDGSEYATGIYFYRLVAGDKSLTKKMVLVK